LEELQNLLEAAKRATVKAYGTVFAGVTVKMSDQYVQMSDYQGKVEFVKTDTGIRLEVLDEPIPED
jgi:uncharacterized protein (DUF342 family)